MEISIEKVIDNINTVYDRRIDRAINNWSIKDQTELNIIMSRAHIQNLQYHKELWINDVINGNKMDIITASRIFSNTLIPAEFSN